MACLRPQVCFGHPDTLTTTSLILNWSLLFPAYSGCRHVLVTQTRSPPPCSFSTGRHYSLHILDVDVFWSPDTLTASFILNVFCSPKHIHLFRYRLVLGSLSHYLQHLSNTRTFNPCLFNSFTCLFCALNFS